MRKRLALSLTVFISLLLLSQGLEIPEVVVYGEREIEISPPEKPQLPFVARDIKTTLNNPLPGVVEEKGEACQPPPDYGYFLQIGGGNIVGAEAGFSTQGKYLPQLIKGVYRGGWDGNYTYFEAAYSIFPRANIGFSCEYTYYLSTGVKNYYLNPGFSFSITELDFIGEGSYSKGGILPGLGLGIYLPFAEVIMHLRGSRFTGEAAWSSERFSIGVGLIDVHPVPVLRANLPFGFYINTRIKTGYIDSFSYIPFGDKNTYRFELGNELAGVGYVFIPEDTINGAYLVFNSIPLRPEIYYIPSSNEAILRILGSHSFNNLYGLTGLTYGYGSNVGFTGFVDLLLGLNRRLSLGFFAEAKTNPFDFRAMVNIRYSSE